MAPPKQADKGKDKATDSGSGGPSDQNQAAKGKSRGRIQFSPTPESPSDDHVAAADTITVQTTALLQGGTAASGLPAISQSSPSTRGTRASSQTTQPGANTGSTTGGMTQAAAGTPTAARTSTVTGAAGSSSGAATATGAGMSSGTAAGAASGAHGDDGGDDDGDNGKENWRHQAIRNEHEVALAKQKKRQENAEQGIANVPSPPLVPDHNGDDDEDDDKASSSGSEESNKSKKKDKGKAKETSSKSDDSAISSSAQLSQGRRKELVDGLRKVIDPKKKLILMKLLHILNTNEWAFDRAYAAWRRGHRAEFGDEAEGSVEPEQDKSQDVPACTDPGQATEAPPSKAQHRALVWELVGRINDGRPGYDPIPTVPMELAQLLHDNNWDIDRAQQAWTNSHTSLLRHNMLHPEETEEQDLQSSFTELTGETDEDLAYSFLRQARWSLQLALEDWAKTLFDEEAEEEDREQTPLKVPKGEIVNEDRKLAVRGKVEDWKLTITVRGKDGKIDPQRMPTKRIGGTFDWNNQAHISRLNRWREQVHRRVTGRTVRPRAIPYHYLEDQYLIDLYRRADAQLRRQNLRKHPINWEAATEDFNTRFSGRMLPGSHFARPNRTAQSLQAEGNRIKAVAILGHKVLRPQKQEKWGLENPEDFIAEMKRLEKKTEVEQKGPKACEKGESSTSGQGTKRKRKPEDGGDKAEDNVENDAEGGDDDAEEVEEDAEDDADDAEYGDEAEIDVDDDEDEVEAGPSSKKTKTK